MTNSLKHKTIRALSWSFIDLVGLRGIQFIIGIVLARILLPEQFGLIGMLIIFMAVAQTFLDSGFGAALIQKQDATQTDISSIFYFNIMVGIIATGLLCVAAPWIAAFFNQPILTPLTRVLSLTIVINSFGMIQTTLLGKHIDFKTQTKVSLTASVLSGIIGITLAYKGFGVWSLAVQQLSAVTMKTVLLWVLNSWRPAWLFSVQSLKEMFGFGSKLLCSGLLNTFFDNIYLVVIGRLFSPADLGYFTKANNLQQFPSSTLSGIVGRVTFPVFSTIQSDHERVKRGMKKALTMMVLVNFPLMIGLAVVARPLVLVLLTDKWTPCVPYLQLLCLMGLMYPLHSINLNVLQAIGRSDLFLRLEIIKKALVVINIVITWRWGIMAMITGQVILSMMSYYLNAYYNKALLKYSIWEQVRDLYPYLISATLMGGLVYAVLYLPMTNTALQLFCQVLTGMIVYTSLCRLLCPAEFISGILKYAKYFNVKEAVQ